jgi:hypothetical protein
MFQSVPADLLLCCLSYKNELPLFFEPIFKLFKGLSVFLNSEFGSLSVPVSFEGKEFSFSGAHVGDLHFKGLFFESGCSFLFVKRLEFLCKGGPVSALSNGDGGDVGASG